MAYPNDAVSLLFRRKAHLIWLSWTNIGRLLFCTEEINGRFWVSEYYSQPFVILSNPKDPSVIIAYSHEYSKNDSLIIA